MKIEDYKSLISEVYSSSAHFQVNKALSRTFGPEKALVLANLLDKYRYFKEQGRIKDDWFFQTHEAQVEETGASEYAIKKHKKSFIKEGILETQMLGMPRKEWYRINLIVLRQVIQNAEKQKKDRKKIKNNSESNTGQNPNNSGGQVGMDYEGHKENKEKENKNNIPYSRKKKEKPKSVDKPSVQHGTVDSRFSLADSKEKKFSQILKNKKIEIPNIERKDLKKNFVGNPAKFKDKKARLGNSQVEKGEYPGAWDALHSLPDDNPHKKLGLAYIEHETKKWDFSNTKNPEVVYKMFCLEYILDAPNALHFLYCLKKDLLKDDLDAYHTRNGLRKSNPIDESKDLLEMWENKY